MDEVMYLNVHMYMYMYCMTLYPSCSGFSHQVLVPDLPDLHCQRAVIRVLSIPASCTRALVALELGILV